MSIASEQDGLECKPREVADLDAHVVKLEVEQPDVEPTPVVPEPSVVPDPEPPVPGGPPGSPEGPTVPGPGPAETPETPHGARGGLLS